MTYEHNTANTRFKETQNFSAKPAPPRCPRAAFRPRAPRRFPHFPLGSGLKTRNRLSTNNFNNLGRPLPPKNQKREAPRLPNPDRPIPHLGPSTLDFGRCQPPPASFHFPHFPSGSAAKNHNRLPAANLHKFT